MALFKIFKGNSSNLSNVKATEGYCYFTPDDGKFYIDIAGDGTTDAVIGTNRICLNAAESDKWANAINIALSGDVTGSAEFDGSGDVTINATVDRSDMPTFDLNYSYGELIPDEGQEGELFFQLGQEDEEEQGGGVPAGGSTGQIIVKNSNEDYDADWYSQTLGGANTPIYLDNGALTACNEFVPKTGGQFTGEISATKVYGAVWNDYAEYRESDVLEPGRCIIENGDDTLSLSNKRMQPGALIISDTFGFSIGKTDKCNTPVAVSGRVLAYTHEDREKFIPGMPVCSGPNGTVSIMSKIEARECPWCIVGTVSAIPKYDTWGTNNIKVDNRIWIKVR